MAVGYPESMRAADGTVARYTECAKVAQPTPPKHPHPDAILHVNWSGHRLHPHEHSKPLAEFLDYLRDNGGQFPVSGDEITRMAAWQCWDDLIRRAPQKTYSGTELCGEPSCPHPQPHTATQWFSDHSPWDPERDPRRGTPFYRDIAHVLYPGGVLPVPVVDEPEPEPPSPKPEQLAIFDALEAMT